MRFSRLGRMLAKAILGTNPRNTDHDWKIIGATEPYYGVLTADRFKRDQLNEVSRNEFFETGRGAIRTYRQKMEELFGPFHPRSALDFGCGVGRLTVPLVEQTGRAIGVDISPGMLAEARQYVVPGLSFQDTIPGEEFDWIVSIIVLQHIPPERGYAILKKLLSLVSPSGGVTIQIMFARAKTHERSVGSRVVISDNNARMSKRVRQDYIVPKGTMIVYDYDLSIVSSLLFAFDMHRIHLEHCNHGGMIGATIYARKNT